MHTIDVIKSRRSTRVFTEDIPSKKVITACLEAATWAPSATNQQPWEFIVLTGTELNTVCDIIEENFAERLGTRDPLGNVPEDYQKRQSAIMNTLIDLAHAEGMDPTVLFEKSLRFFGAPVGIYFVTRKSSDEQYLLSTAAALENFLLAAQSLGLGTCWLTVTVVCEEDIKHYLGLTDEKKLLAGVAVGYPDASSPFNRFKRTRVPVEDCTRWLGFL